MGPSCRRTQKREHVATAAEREHGSNTYYLKQPTAGGAGTNATSKHPDVQKEKDWHRENVRRQGSNTSSQPQNFNWQWRD